MTEAVIAILAAPYVVILVLGIVYFREVLSRWRSWRITVEAGLDAELYGEGPEATRALVARMVRSREAWRLLEEAGVDPPS